MVESRVETGPLFLELLLRRSVPLEEAVHLAELRHIDDLITVQIEQREDKIRSVLRNVSRHLFQTKHERVEFL
jgi:hypothetical protein